MATDAQGNTALLSLLHKLQEGLASVENMPIHQAQAAHNPRSYRYGGGGAINLSQPQEFLQLSGPGLACATVSHLLELVVINRSMPCIISSLSLLDISIIQGTGVANALALTNLVVLLGGQQGARMLELACSDGICQE